MTPLITSRTDWTPDLLREIWEHIDDVGKNDLKLDYYDPQIEIISAEQMIDSYASVGLPVMYHHWSFGKEFLSNWNKYQKGKMGLAYEVVINSSPCIAYLMEENNAVTQALVMAHASVGHSAVFKNNYLFKEWTSAGSIIDYLLFAKSYIRDCEMRYGQDEVELLLDAAHALANHGVDKRKRKHKKKLTEEQKLAKDVADADEEQKNLDIIIKSTSKQDADTKKDEDRYEVADEENLLYFLMKYSPTLEPWKREVLRIIYKIHQYFYPQRQTQVLNEGFATFTHFYIMDTLEKKGVISADAQISWLHQHSNVIYQPTYTSRHYTGRFNPYAFGLAILNDVRRICENPTAEDREWFPAFAGTGEWRKVTQEAVSDYRDESFIEQFLSPNVIRKWNLFAVEHYDKMGIVTEISDDAGYRNIRSALASQYTTVNSIPDIAVKAARMRGDRMLTLEYRPYNQRSLHRTYAEKTIEYVKLLWGYNVEIIENGERIVFV